jgi:hypothetical protein
MEISNYLTAFSCLLIFILAFLIIDKPVYLPLPKRQLLFVCLFLALAVCALIWVPSAIESSDSTASEGTDQMRSLTFAGCAVLVAISLGVFASNLLNVLRQKLNSTQGSREPKDGV